MARRSKPRGERSAKKRAKDGGKGRDKRRERGSRGGAPARSGDNSTPILIGVGVIGLFAIVFGLVAANSGSQSSQPNKARRRTPPSPAPAAAPAPAQRASPAPARSAAPRTSTPRGTRSVPAARPASGGAPVKPNVRLTGAIGKRGDMRRLQVSCAGCGQTWNEKGPSCPKCASRIVWPDKVSCPYCAAGVAGKCGVCKGTGKNPHFDPTARLPFGMKKSGAASEKCPACGHSGKCKHCDGSGRFALRGYF